MMTEVGQRQEETRITAIFVPPYQRRYMRPIQMVNLLGQYEKIQEEIDKAEKHYYQPLWTLVGTGVFPKEETERSQADYIPDGATWVKDYVASFDPDNNTVTTEGGEKIEYEYLVVTAGIQVNWDAIPGLKESVGKPGTGIVSNYSYDTVESTWEAIKSLKSGTAIFTHPSTPI